jgi:urease accessory protein
MGWHANLKLDYTLESERSVARYAHYGPLRVLKSLYPEGDSVCHNVLVHPPGGLVGGDTLDIQVTVGEGAHGLITTPGAARFYRSDGAPALQRTTLKLASGARLEWLPLEALLYSGCIAENKLVFDLEPGAQMLGWDVISLGLPDANLAFDKGTFSQHIEMPGHWLERGTLAATDTQLLHSPLGLAGHTCIASLFFAAGSNLDRALRDTLLDAAREVTGVHALKASAGATSPGPRMVVLRVLAPRVEPAMDLLRKVWLAWRGLAWGKPADMPRIWAM